MTGRDRGRRGEHPNARDLLGLISDIGGTIAVASMLLAVIIGAGSVVIGLASDRPTVVFLGVTFASGVTFGAFCMYAIAVRRLSSVESQLGYRWINATYTYIVDSTDPHRHCQKTEVEIKAIRDGVRTFSNQYRWSGSGEELPPQITSFGHSFSGDIERSLAWRRYDVRLEPHLSRGQTTTVSLVQDLYDSDERFELFLAKSVHQPTEQLTLCVKLPVNLAPERAWSVEQVSAGPGARVIRQREVSPLLEDGYVVMEWQVIRPVQGRAYQLRWAYSPDRSLYSPAFGTVAEDEPR